MPPKTVMTADEVAADIEEKKLNVREYESPRTSKHPGVNRTFEVTAPTPMIADPYMGATEDDGEDKSLIENIMDGLTGKKDDEDSSTTPPR